MTDFYEEFYSPNELKQFMLVTVCVELSYDEVILSQSGSFV